VLTSLDLLSFIVEDLATKQLILEWTGHYRVEVQVAIHIGRDKTVVALDELADLDFRKRSLVIGAKCTFLFLILMVLNVDVTIIGSCRSGLLFRPEIYVVQPTVGLSASKRVAVLALSSLRIIIIKDV